MRFKNITYVFIFIIILAVFIFNNPSFAQETGGVRMPIPKIAFDIEEASSPKDVALSLQILFLLTILTLAPSIMIMMTSFTRLAVVFSLIRHALGTQQMPPNQIIIGLALLLTFFLMSPVYNRINSEALQPYLAEEISQESNGKKSDTGEQNQAGDARNAPRSSDGMAYPGVGHRLISEPCSLSRVHSPLLREFRRETHRMILPGARR